MKSQVIKSDVLLLITAIIWGFAFVAQRMGMDYVEPFTFNGFRFALGSLSLIPLLLIQRVHFSESSANKSSISLRYVVISGGLTGLALFTGASLQQIGLVYTTAGKAGFITGLYVVIVPIILRLVGQRSSVGTWIGAFLAVIGLFFLSVTDEFTVEFGDFLEIIGAFFWAGHVILVGFFSRKIHPIKLSFIQFVTCSLLSLLTAVFIETITLSSLLEATVPILYGGLCSVGIAYTLQVVAQRDAHPSHAAILLSLESVFAAIGGWLILNEFLSLRAIGGCGLMFAGMLFSQLYKRR